MALATVYETEGSTYSKAGATMLVDGDGMFQGMLSGGCLEGDLAVRARVAIESGSAQKAIYDLGGGDDELWGMGVGCEGVMRVLLQPLYASNAYQPWVALSDAASGRENTLAVVVVDGAEGAPAGATLLLAGARVGAYGLDGAVADELSSGFAAGEAAETATCVEKNVAGRTLRLLHYHVQLQPRLLVLGAGPDAGPVVRFAGELGWHTTLADHRPAYLDQPAFDTLERRVSAPAAELGRQVVLDEFDLAIVMSHHLASDREYLAQLATAEIPYIGLLGPPARRDRLVSEIGRLASRLEGRLHAPAGFELGGRGPAPIALSILAEMQAYLTDGPR